MSFHQRAERQIIKAVVVTYDEKIGLTRCYADEKKLTCPTDRSICVSGPHVEVVDVVDDARAILAAPDSTLSFIWRVIGIDRPPYSKAVCAYLI